MLYHFMVTLACVNKVFYHSVDMNTTFHWLMAEKYVFVSHKTSHSFRSDMKSPPCDTKILPYSSFPNPICTPFGICSFITKHARILCVRD